MSNRLFAHNYPDTLCCQMDLSFSSKILSEIIEIAQRLYKLPVRQYFDINLSLVKLDRSGKSAVDDKTGFCVFNANLPYALLSSFMTFWCPVIVMVTVYYRVFRFRLIFPSHICSCC